MELILQMNAEEAIEVTKNGTLKALAESIKTHGKASAESAEELPQAPSMDCASSIPVETPTQAPMPGSAAPVWTAGGGAVDDSTPQTPTPQTAVPTEAKSYTADELQKAAIALMDKGVSMDDIAALLGKHGVSSLPELTPGKFGAFALDLRQLGADI
jgi:hypothetical protein|nr:MAG TPA: protein of unknown function (DUF438) [Caudoviricetes sp.]DAW29295.1 MAG TPA: protein of unknown function (DUF438) [Caudoviricetes sp.]